MFGPAVPRAMLRAVVLALGIVTALVALTHWTACAVGRERPGWYRVEWWTKLLTMVGLIAVAVAAGAAGSATGWWLLVALFFGLLGDLALLGHGDARFVAGVAAFLVGHLAYVVCFVRLGLPAPGWSWAGVAVLALVLVATRRTAPVAYRLAGARMAVSIAVYSGVIGVMLLLAWLTGIGPVAAGATVFVVSDSLIAMTMAATEMGRPTGRTQVAVMITYHAGQALIVAGVLHALS